MGQSNLSGMDNSAGFLGEGKKKKWKILTIVGFSLKKEKAIIFKCFSL